MDESYVILEIPLEKVTNVKVLGFKVSVSRIILGQQVILSVYINIEREDKIFVEHREVIIKDDDYLAWGTDDKYIIDFVQSKLLTLV